MDVLPSRRRRALAGAFVPYAMLNSPGGSGLAGGGEPSPGKAAAAGQDGGVWLEARGGRSQPGATARSAAPLPPVPPQVMTSHRSRAPHPPARQARPPTHGAPTVWRASMSPTGARGWALQDCAPGAVRALGCARLPRLGGNLDPLFQRQGRLLPREVEVVTLPLRCPAPLPACAAQGASASARWRGGGPGASPRGAGGRGGGGVRAE